MSLLAWWSLIIGLCVVILVPAIMAAWFEVQRDRRIKRLTDRVAVIERQLGSQQ